MFQQSVSGGAACARGAPAITIGDVLGDVSASSRAALFRGHTTVDTLILDSLVSEEMSSTVSRANELIPSIEAALRMRGQEILVTSARPPKPHSTYIRIKAKMPLHCVYPQILMP